MRRALLTLIVSISLLVPAQLRADSPVLKVLRDYIESLRVQAGIPGLAVAVVGSTDIVWEEAFGRQDIEQAVAARTDTPFHLDGLTQTFAASLVLRCVEEGRLTLDDRIGGFSPSSPEPNATIRELLTHTSGGTNPVFSYRPERLGPLAAVIRACTDDSFRESLANQLDRLAMKDSVPGPDSIHLTPPAEGIPEPAVVERYTAVLNRLAIPYAVDQQKRATRSQYAATTLTPALGLISTVRDLAQFDLGLKKGVLLRAETLALAWTPPLGGDGQPLPHGLGWFAQSYAGEKVVWQFGVGPNASSALVVSVPARGLTYVLLANSMGLVEPLPLTATQLMASPFVRVLLSFFTG